MRCPRCQHLNEADAKFCEECAAPLSRTCGQCGRQLSPTAKFCPACARPTGVTLDAASAPRFTSPEKYTPKHLAEKIINSKAALEGERKQVTVLFADLKGSMELLADRDPEEARKILDPVIEHMMEAVHRYEGTVNQVMGDGIMALFGAPLAHEDHAVRACYAALRMQENVRKYAEQVRRSHAAVVKVRVGLNSGEVVVRAIGSDLHMDYTAVGQTTHLAARMEQIAEPGAIVITPETLRLAEGYVEVKSLGPVPVKGLAGSLEVYEVSGAGPARTRLQVAARRGLTQLVGREAELEQLRRAQQLAGTGHGQVAAIVGEAGVGKSRLVYEFTHSHRLQGWLVLEAASVSYGRATSYLPVIDLLRGYFKTQDRDELREVREKVMGKVLTLDETLKAALPALLALLDVPVDDAAWRTLDPAQRRQQTLDAVKRLLLREAREQPLLVIFEDLHWIDSETQALLDGLVDSLGSARLLLLVNYRPEYQHAWSNRTYYSQMRLDALPVESAGALLDALLGADAGLLPLKQLLVRRGNPFFLEETVRTLVETKALAGEPGRYQLTQPVLAIQVPPTVQVMLAARIDRLAPEDKRLLQVASVIGKEVPWRLLQAIADLPDEALRRGLDHLQAAEFLYETRLFPDLEYTFKHALTHEVAYGTLLAERRRVLHAQVVETIEAGFADRLAEQVEQLAHHSFRGEVWAKALRYMRQAGQKAASRSAHREAVACLDQALAALAHLPEDREALEEAIDLRLDLRTSLIPLTELSRTRAVLEEAARLADSIGDRRRLGQALALLGNYYYEIAQSDKSIDCAERALGIARDLGDPELEAGVTFLLGQNHYGLGNYTRAIDLLVQNVAALEAAQLDVTYHVGPARLSVTARCFLARTLAEIGEFRQAVTRAEEAITLSESDNEAFGLAHGFFALGVTYLRQGNLARAIALLERGFGVASARTVSFLEPLIGSHLGYAQALSGHIQEGLSLLEQAYREGKRTGRTGVVIWVQQMLAEVHLECGREANAAATAQDALDTSRRTGRRGGEARVLRILGDIAASGAAPDFDKAERFYRDALDLAGELGIRPLVAHCHLGFGKLYHRGGSRAEAQEHLATATTMYREMGMTFWLQKAEVEMRKFP
jgi:class 3 adenylate cyclase/tetratricopeptide (TPR) repeat protein